MGKTYTVYKHITPNGKVYIGASKNYGSRFGTNGRGYGHQPFWQAIQEFGWENIKHEIIADGLSKHQAEALEAKVIAEHNATDHEFGYNVRRYGTINNDKPLKGEAYNRIVELNRSKEHRDACKLANFKRLGIPLDSKSRRERIAENKTNKKKYVCFETGEAFETAAEAEKKTGIKAGCIRDACNKRYATAGGLHWCYSNETDTFQPQKGIRPVTRRVTNVETGEIFQSGKEAARRYGKSTSSISYAARHPNAKCAGFHWVFTDGEWK